MLESRHCGPCCRSGEIGRRKGLKIFRTRGKPATDATSQESNPVTKPDVAGNIYRSYSFGDACDSIPRHAAVAESAYARDLKSRGSKGRSGSSPDSRTKPSNDDMSPRKSIANSSIPPGIRQRGPVWQVDVTVRGSRRTGTAATLEEAITLREELKGRLATGTLTGRVWTLQIAIQKCYEAVWSNARSGLKLRANAEDAALFLGATTRVTDITTDRVDDYIASLKKLGNSGATCNRKLAALSKVLAFAVRRSDTSGLKSKPHLERQPEHEGRLRWLTKEEEDQLLSIFAKLGKPDHVDAVIVLIDSGLRGSELWRLEQRDIDLTKGTLTIWQSKNKNPRTVPMTQRVKDIFTRRMKTHKPRVFPFNNDWLGDCWDLVRAKMGLSKDPQFVPYALRHTCASRLVQRGVNLRVIQEWMGHQTITVTMRYAHLSPTNLIEAVKVLEPK